MKPFLLLNACRKISGDSSDQLNSISVWISQWLLTCLFGLLQIQDIQQPYHRVKVPKFNVEIPTNAANKNEKKMHKNTKAFVNTALNEAATPALKITKMVKAIIIKLSNADTRTNKFWLSHKNGL